MGRNFENRKHAIFKTAGQKSKLYSKYGKQLYVIAKNGTPDPDANPGLRALIEKAKRDQVPAHVIEKAIQKAKGAGGEDFAPARYEGFSPGGAMVIIDCPPILSWITINAFTASDKVLVPVSPGSFELDSTVQIGKTIEEVTKEARTALTKADVMDGVADLIPMVQIEAVFTDGSRLVTVHSPIQ